MLKGRLRAGTALALVVALGLAGCGGDDAEDAADSAAAAADSASSVVASAADSAVAAAESGASAAESAVGDAVAGAGDAAAGKEVFSSNCAGCHTLADAGASGAVGPNLDDVKPDAATVAAKVTAGGGGMPPFGDKLSPEDIVNVAAYVSSAAGS